MYGNSGEKVVDTTITHMFEYHAINPDEMTTCMRTKIKENVQYILIVIVCQDQIVLSVRKVSIPITLDPASHLSNQN